MGPGLDPFRCTLSSCPGPGAGPGAGKREMMKSYFLSSGTTSSREERHILVGSSNACAKDHDRAGHGLLREQTVHSRLTRQP